LAPAPVSGPIFMGVECARRRCEARGEGMGLLHKARPPLVSHRQHRGLRQPSAGQPSLARDTERAMSQENLANLRRGYEAFTRGDRSAVTDLVTPRC